MHSGHAYTDCHVVMAIPSNRPAMFINVLVSFRTVPNLAFLVISIGTTICMFNLSTPLLMAISLMMIILTLISIVNVVPKAKRRC